MQTLTVSLRPCFFIYDEPAYDIWDDFPVPIRAVWDEEIVILMPHLMKQILEVIKNEQSNRSPLCKGQYR